jgi:hypothetical protein
MDDRGIVVRFPAREEDFDVLQSVDTGSETVLGHIFIDCRGKAAGARS